MTMSYEEYQKKQQMLTIPTSSPGTITMSPTGISGAGYVPAGGTFTTLPLTSMTCTTGSVWPMPSETYNAKVFTCFGGAVSVVVVPETRSKAGYCNVAVLVDKCYFKNQKTPNKYEDKCWMSDQVFEEKVPEAITALLNVMLTPKELEELMVDYQASEGAKPYAPTSVPVMSIRTGHASTSWTSTIGSALGVGT